MKYAKKFGTRKNRIERMPKLTSDNRVTQAQLTKPDRDHMPVTVATELLCKPGANITGPMRRECKRAREKHYVSTAVRKPSEGKLVSRLSRSTIAQIGKWLRRAIERRADAQREYIRLQRLAEKYPAMGKTIESRLVIIDARAAGFDHARDILETEIEARARSQKLIRDCRLKITKET